MFLCLGSTAELVTADSEERGFLKDWVRLYDLDSKHDRVVEFLYKFFSQVIAATELRRDRMRIRQWPCKRWIWKILLF